MTDEKQSDFYQSLRGKIKAWSETEEGKNYRWTRYVLLVPDFFHVQIKLLMDDRVPLGWKALFGFVVAYFISPLDLMPEAVLGPVGYLDDLALSAFALNGLMNSVSEQVVIDNWAGDEDVVKVVKAVIATADDMLGSGRVKALKKLIAKYMKASEKESS